MKPVFMCLQALMIVAILSSCIGLSHLRELDVFQKHYSKGEFLEASELLSEELGFNYDPDPLLISLHAAAALRASGKIEDSQIMFDQAEQLLLWKSNDIVSVNDLLEAGLTLATNDLLVPYQGTIYDGIMLNTYKALNAMSISDVDRARVELNRATQRQQNAVNQLSSKIRAIEATGINSLQKGSQDIHDVSKKNDWERYSEREIIDLMASIERFGVYRYFYNPFTTWLHALFRLSTKEPNRAADLLRKIVVFDNNPISQVVDDLIFAEQIADGNRGEPRVWLIHEDGIGPRLEQSLFQYPMPTEFGSVSVSVAVPYLLSGIPAYGKLELYSDGYVSATEPLLDVNRYIATEFQAGYQALLIRSVISAGIRTLVQMEVQKNTDKQEFFGSLMSAIVPTIAQEMTQADTRMWQTLPNTIGVASFSRPANGKLRIMANSIEIVDVTLPDGEFVLVNIITTQPGSPFRLSTVVLGGE